MTLLHLAAFGGQPECDALLLDRGADMGAKNEVSAACLGRQGLLHVARGYPVQCDA
jgi:hypothetical protein